PGIGYGGSCFPKDVRSLVSVSEGAGYTPQILRAVDGVNNRQKEVLPAKVVARYGEDLSGRRFAVWGLAFKPNTDDMREAPSLSIIRALAARGAHVQAYDPQAMEAARTHYFQEEVQSGALRFAKDRYAVLEGADALLLLTEWQEFKSPDFDRIKEALKEPVLFDGRNQFDDRALVEAGFTYIRIGYAPCADR
ncbi:MAG: UDP-glucose 6-dehydrogenase, partial [Clostridiales Family XIII bacterium]|nr:UDP-glucose 6-dehydrogenase [Clostridiales Family XIII bacterium]